MKFSVSSSALLSLLATTGKVISNKNTLPILDYFLMELNGNELKVTTSDLETTLIGSITVDSVESEGTIAAPAKLMLDSLKEFSELPLTIDVNDKNWEITINWKSGSLSIPGASAVSYPAVPQLSAEKKELRLDVDMLEMCIRDSIHIAGRVVKREVYRVAVFRPHAVQPQQEALVEFEVVAVGLVADGHRQHQCHLERCAAAQGAEFDLLRPAAGKDPRE